MEERKEGKGRRERKESIERMEECKRGRKGKGKEKRREAKMKGEEAEKEGKGKR